MVSIIFVLLLLLFFGILSNSLSILAISGIIIVVGYKYRNLFKKAYILYILALVIVALSVYFFTYDWVKYIEKGLIGYAFLLVVMITGTLPSKWALTINLKINRGVFSILAFILISPHAIYHVLGFSSGVNLFGIVAYVLMIPLTIISFKVVRKEIEVKDWIMIQKAAYIIYLALFVHLLMVASWENKIIYAVIFTLYLNNRFIKELKK